MVRKLSLMLVLTLGLVPFVAQALGLGDIKLNSALNQKFDAEIKLLSLAKGEIHDVKVIMASDKAFKRSGVDRTFLLTTLIFKTEQKADGSSVVRVTSKNPIREPFLNFLIEVNWPKGRLIREYTVLLDPPVTLKRKPAPIQAPKVTQKLAAPVPAPAKAVPAIEQAPVSGTPVVGGVGEVEVQNNQSLWVIARNHQHQGVDHTRMMMAIYRANPQAFYKSNINRLKKGAILRIPEKEDVLELDARTAQSEYKQHVEEWQADRLGTKKGAEPVIAEDAEQTEKDAKAEEKVAEEQESEAKPKEEDKGQAAEAEPKEEKQADADAKTEEEKKAEAEKKGSVAEDAKPEADVAQEAKAKEKKAVPEAELKIATARPEGKGEAGPSEDGQSEATVARLKQELLILEESAESVKGENEELSSRVTDLEDQVGDLERILELKNSQFAALQAALAKSKKEQILLAESQKQQESESTAKAESATAQEVKEPEVVKQPETVVAKEEKQPESDVATAEEKPVVAKVEKKPEPVVEEKQPESVVKPLPKVEMKPAKVAPVVTPKEEPSLLGSILSSPTLLGIALAVIMVLIALVWLILGRKRTNTADFQESILLNTIDEDVDSSVLDESSNIPAHTEETSFLSDFSPSDIDALQDETGEVDPSSEADVYIAYGRYQQAEELIRQAIDKEPERDALKHKLFEILYATKNSDGFVNLIEESSGTTVETRDSDAWNRALSMGKMLLPKHPKFADAAEIEADDDLFSLDDDLLEEDLGESDFADLDETLTKAEFGAGEAGKQADAAQHDEINDESVADDSLDISSDLDDTGVGLDDLDFDTNMDDDFISAALDELEELDDSLETEETKTEQVSLEDELEDEFTLTLSDLEDEGEKTILSLQDELNEDQGDILANELEDTSLDVPSMEPEEGDSELISLGDLDVDLSINEDTPDEISTKLDLAKAYIEMGDKEGATDILDEVLGEGDAAQQEAAQKIKDSIA